MRFRIIATARAYQAERCDLASAVQLAIEYDPAPPLDSGSAEKASPETTRTVLAGLAAADANWVCG